MKTAIFLITLALFAIAVYYASTLDMRVADFASCAAKGYAIMESYPRQCRTPSGKTYVEDIGNELEKANLIKITSPRPNDVVASPLTITGTARGYWFFEASFPIHLEDANGTEIAVAPASALSEWMTTDFVPFSVTLDFIMPATKSGKLILRRDNPSGLSENDDALIVPVYFESNPL